jgi:hypothetical protein
VTTKIFARFVKDKVLQLTSSALTAAVLMLSIFAAHIVDGCFSSHQETAADGEVEGVPEGRIVPIFFGSSKLEV